MTQKLAATLHWMWHRGANCQQAAEFDLHQSIEKLKQTWAVFREIIDVIAREEIKISREELDKQIEARYSRNIRHVG